MIDPAGDSSIKNDPVVADNKLSVIPSGILSSSDKLKTENNFSTNLNLLSARAISINNNSFATSSTPPLSDTVREQAVSAVNADLKKGNVLTEKGDLTKELISELEFEFTTTIPTPGIVVKGCLDECNVCEPSMEESIKLELERKKLKNKLLQRKIDLLESSQEYRCCPATDEEAVETE